MRLCHTQSHSTFPLCGTVIHSVERFSFYLLCYAESWKWQACNTIDANYSQEIWFCKMKLFVIYCTILTQACNTTDGNWSDNSDSGNMKVFVIHYTVLALEKCFICTSRHIEDKHILLFSSLYKLHTTRTTLLCQIV